MPDRTTSIGRQFELRTRSMSRLTVPSHPVGEPANASSALAVLLQLASSPETAADALALLHELQVHQVELELQDEELRSARLDLEAALARQVQLYDCAPVGFFTIDGKTLMCELNLTGARLLGVDRDALWGRPLNSCLAPAGSRALHAMLARIDAGRREASGMLQLAAREGGQRSVHASATADPAGSRYLLTLAELAD